MTHQNPSRQPKGLPVGGQFAASARNEADGVALATETLDESTRCGSCWEDGYETPADPSDENGQCEGCADAEWETAIEDDEEIVFEFEALGSSSTFHVTCSDDEDDDEPYSLYRDGTFVGTFSHNGDPEDHAEIEQSALRIFPVTVPATVPNEPVITPAAAYEMNRAQASALLDRYSVAVNDGTDNGALRFDLGVAAAATWTSLRDNRVYGALGEDEKAVIDRLSAATTHQIRVGVTNKPEARDAAGRIAESLSNALSVGDVNVRTYDGKNAAHWYAEAARCERQAQDSFERSDTDGFRSQAASQSMAGMYTAAGRLAEHGGKWTFPALMDADGNLVPAQMVDTRHGRAWMLLDENGNSTGKFVNPSNASTAARRNAAMAKKGYAEGLVRVPATVGLSEGLRPYPVYERADRRFDPVAEIVATSETDD